MTQLNQNEASTVTMLSSFSKQLEILAVNWYVKQLYTKEDYLFKVIFDKAHRPELYKQTVDPRIETKVTKQDLLDFNDISNNDTNNFLSQNYSSQIFKMTFDELALVETRGQNRMGLLYKYPLVFSLIGLLIFKRRVQTRQKNYFLRDMYLKVDNEAVFTSNNLNQMLLFIEVSNLVSFSMGACLSGVFYFNALWKRYFTLQKNEEELAQKYLRQIQCYHRIFKS
ncbi:UNKNOWN [Stylonychia lemnae]|uniref:Uncharacterized protein n=1 Tax=Stylonychia lemnae TaxID=5949 RepID=A0A078B7C4_STYLE|nr:UNKNOWN [Stylonychia lemnae]|eukprot:CDW90111.1 UNKNOWN [Stylonychia lemnae]